MPSATVLPTPRKRPSEAPRAQLELPMYRPDELPKEATDEEEEAPERGVTILDFYI